MVPKPARLLDKGTYEYTGSDTIDAQQIKPQTVAEAEFRLSDDMYPLSNLMGGPNGSKARICHQACFLASVLANFGSTRCLIYTRR